MTWLLKLPRNTGSTKDAPPEIRSCAPSQALRTTESIWVGEAGGQRLKERQSAHTEWWSARGVTSVCENM